MAVYHLKVGYGSRAGGQSAAAKRDYIERDGRYERDRDELEHHESGNMPEWAQDDPRAYWQAADEHERANGRLYSEIQFALPRELDAAGRQALAGAFAEQVCAWERLPYTLALHSGGADSENPHAHLMFSERGHDGIERSAEQWFTRYNAKAPEKGGARKSRAAKAGDWLATTRQTWEQTANRALEQAGREARIDHRSLADRRDAAARDGDLDRAAELSREPNIHLGPSRHRASDGAAALEKRRQARRVERANAAHAGRAGHRPSAGGRAWSRRSPRSGRGCRRPMTEFEERLTHEYSKLAAQYAQEQQQLSGQVARLAEQVRHLADQQSADQQGYIKWSKTLGEQVEHLGKQVQHLADQHGSDQQGYVKWSKYMDEQQGILNAHVETLTKAYNELARLLDAG